MRRARRTLTGLVGAALALAGVGMIPAGAATSQGGLTWAPAARATVHPGVMVNVAQVRCPVGFVLTDGRRVFLTIPATCSGVSDGQPTNGCTEAQVPYGLPVAVQGARYKAKLVYSSFTRMQLQGEKRPNRCDYNDLTLLQLDRRDIRRTNPSVPLVGGPSGVSSAAPAFPDQLTVILASATKAEALSTTNGGWAHSAMVDAEVNKLDVGAPVLTSNGNAIGMVSFVPQQGGPGQTMVTDLLRELRALRNTPGFGHVHLAVGTRHYVSPGF